MTAINKIIVLYFGGISKRGNFKEIQTYFEKYMKTTIIEFILNNYTYFNILKIF